MTGSGTITADREIEESRRSPSSLGRVAQGVARIALALATVAWLRMTYDGWRLRSIVNEYMAIHGGYDLHANPWPGHLRTFHDDLMSVGADYFYPFAWAMLVAIALVWAVLAIAATKTRRHWRYYLLGGALGALILQLAVLGPALVTYINVTD